MNETRRLIFIHGLEGTSHGVKAKLLRERLPGILTPDFRGSLEERMVDLRAMLSERDDWTIIGSSLGGLMATMYACEGPRQVAKLVLLAPALIWPDFADALPKAVDVPTVIYHGIRDVVVPLEAARRIAEQVFTRLEFHPVDDDHGLYQTVHSIDWPALIGQWQR